MLIMNDESTICRLLLRLLFVQLIFHLHLQKKAFIYFSFQDHKMKVLLIVVVLLLVLHHACDAIPTNRWSCYKKLVKDRNCRDTGLERMRPIDSLENHYWEGNECDVVCYCNHLELLCCPR